MVDVQHLLSIVFGALNSTIHHLQDIVPYEVPLTQYPNAGAVPMENFVM